MELVILDADQIQRLLGDRLDDPGELNTKTYCAQSISSDVL